MPHLKAEIDKYISYIRNTIFHPNMSKATFTFQAAPHVQTGCIHGKALRVQLCGRIPLSMTPRKFKKNSCLNL